MMRSLSLVCVCFGASVIGPAMLTSAIGQPSPPASALACAVAYTLDWEVTTSPERSAADRKGAETTFAALRAQMSSDDETDAVLAAQTTLTRARVGNDLAALSEMVAGCDKNWNGTASSHDARYGAMAGSTTPEADADGASAAATVDDSDSPAITSSADTQPDQCSITDQRAAGIMNLWTNSLADYVAGGERDYDTERELGELYNNLRSRLTDEQSTAKTYGCDALADDISQAMSTWENPF